MKFPEQVQLMADGKLADMAYCVNILKVIYVFNISHTRLEFFQYIILEALKDCLVSIQKYTPVMKVMTKILVLLLEEDKIDRKSTFDSTTESKENPIGYLEKEYPLNSLYSCHGYCHLKVNKYWT